jgi:hypothetical protein
MSRRRTFALALLVSAAVALTGVGSVPAAIAPTVVTIQFDDGTAD